MLHAEILQKYITAVNEALDHYLPVETSYPAILARAMRYSVFAGGKRLRPLLVIASNLACGGQVEESLPVASAIEMIHTYSLIHDDLPALDNDDYRRGKPTCHKVFGEAMAILAGDALLTHSFYILSNMQKVSDLIKVKIIKEISNAAGFAGMVGGQVVDIESEGKSLPDKDTLNYIHSHKTGALITAAVRCGAFLAKASEDKLELLTAYGKSLGLAFQIVDDLLDEVGDEKKMGKRVQKDASLKKLTYPSLYGLQESKHKVEELYKEAVRAIAPFGENKSLLELLAKIIVKRDY